MLAVGARVEARFAGDVEVTCCVESLPHRPAATTVGVAYACPWSTLPTRLRHCHRHCHHHDHATHHRHLLYHRQWFPGSVSTVHPGSSGEFVYSIAYDDGDSEAYVHRSLIRLSDAPAPEGA